MKVTNVCPPSIAKSYSPPLTVWNNTPQYSEVNRTVHTLCTVLPSPTKLTGL